MQKFIWPIRVYYEDTDAGGVVYHANYINFFERARTEMLRDKGIQQTELKRTEQVIFVVRSLKIEYHKSAQVDDFLEISSEIIQIKKASLVFEQIMSRNEIVLCSATVSVACVDSQTLRPKLIPEDLRAEFL